MIFASRIIIVVYYKIYMLFYLFIIFVNFILIVTKVKKTHFFNKFSITKIVLIILPLIIFIVLKDFSFPAHNIYKYIIGSFVYSFSKIFPGVSSTSILINLGFYDEVMLFFSHPLSAFLNNWILWLFFWLSFMFFSLCFIKFIKYLINTDIFDDLLICVMVVNFILLLVNI